MVLDILLLTIGLVGLLIASIIDIKTREVPDLLNYGLIIAGSAIHLFNAIIYDKLQALFTTALGFLAILVIANLMYYTRQWGGGDAKLLMAISIVFAQYPETLLNYFSPNLEPFPFLMIFFINLLILGSIYGFLYTIGIAIKNRKRFLKHIRLVSEDAQTAIIKKLSVLAAIFIIAVLAIFYPSMLNALSITIALFIAAFPYILTFVRVVEKSSMLKVLDISRVSEGDWVATDIIIHGKKIYSSKSPGITKHQIQQLKDNKIRKVLVKEGIPFVPSFLLAMIFTLVFGNILPI